MRACWCMCRGRLPMSTGGHTADQRGGCWYPGEDWGRDKCCHSISQAATGGWHGIPKGVANSLRKPPRALFRAVLYFPDNLTSFRNFQTHSGPRPLLLSLHLRLLNTRGRLLLWASCALTELQRQKDGVGRTSLLDLYQGR